MRSTSGNTRRAPEVAENEQDYVTQAIRWAQQVGNVLYVSTAHRTYAASSGGRNAYLTAIDVGSRVLPWRSAPLVANADTFEVVGDRIVAGYGFTAEPDRLYLLDRGTGAVTGGIPLGVRPGVHPPAGRPAAGALLRHRLRGRPRSVIDRTGPCPAPRSVLSGLAGAESRAG